MDLKKEYFYRKIKQETESEPYSNISETFASPSNLLQVKFEDTTYTNNEPEDQIESTLETVINGGLTEEPNALKECKTVQLTKNVEVELITNTQICRLCAQPITSTEIFLYEDGDLEQKINYILPITIGLGDGLPEYICRNCEINLNMFYDFVCQVTNANKALTVRINPPDFKTNDVTSAVIKEIFGTEEELEEETIESGLLQDDQQLEEQTNEDCMQDDQLLEVETNEGYLENDQLFEEETNEGRLQDHQLSEEEPDLKHLTDLKSPLIRINEKKPNKHLIQVDDNFRPLKIQKISISHTSVQEKQEQYKCQLCKQIFSDYFALAHHNKETLENICYSCPETDCSKIFTTQKSLRQHIVDRHNVPVICYSCGKIFAHQGALEKHQDNAHFLKVCDNCGMLFKSSLSFKTHRLLHAEVSEFQCVYCYKNFKNRHKLHRHTRQSHSGNFTLLVDMNEDEFKKNGSS